MTPLEYIVACLVLGLCVGLVVAVVSWERG